MSGVKVMEARAELVAARGAIVSAPDKCRRYRTKHRARHHSSRGER